MKEYFIRYNTKDSKFDFNTSVDAKDVKSAKNKIERKLNKKIQITEVKVLGYY